MARIHVVVGVLLFAASLVAEERHPAVHCEANGTLFTCVAIEVAGIDGVPKWTLMSTPQHITYGLAVTDTAPKQWTLLKFEDDDPKNHIRLRILVRQRKDKAEFAASTTAEQTVEPQ